MDEIRSIITNHAIPARHSCAQANEDIKSDSGNEGSDSSEKRHRSQSPNNDTKSEATIRTSLELRSRSSSSTFYPSSSQSPPRGRRAPPADVDSDPEHSYSAPPRPGPLSAPLAPQWTNHEQRARNIMTCPDQGLHERGAEKYLTQNEDRAAGAEHDLTGSEQWSPDADPTEFQHARRASAARQPELCMRPGDLP